MVHTTESTTVYIHEGFGFDAAGHGTILANQNIVLLGKVGVMPVHLNGFEIITSKGPFLIELIESPTISSNGTQFQTPNRNRESTRTAVMQTFIGSTITGGTVLSTRKIHSVGGGSHTESGEGGFNGEWVLKPNTNYAFRLTNLDTTASCDYSASFFFYEVDV